MPPGWLLVRPGKTGLRLNTYVNTTLNRRQTIEEKQGLLVVVGWVTRGKGRLAGRQDDCDSHVWSGCYYTSAYV